MKTETKPSIPIDLKDRIDYRRLPLLQLIGRIANNMDKQAMTELLNNRKLSHRKSKYRLAEYIEMLKYSKTAWEWCGHEDPVLEEAYNGTIDKFVNLPAQTNDNEQPKFQGSNCCWYYKAYLIYATNRLKKKPPANALQAEMIADEILLSFVRRIFRFSCWEGRRKEYGFVRRYCLKRDHGNLYLWVPREIPSQQCRQWLETNISDIDPRRPGEKERVQQIVNQLVAKKQIYLLSELHQVGEELPSSPDPLASIFKNQISVDGLADMVADEKAENIEQQRQKIQQLGKDKLKELICTVFTTLANGKYVEKDIAGSFGLSTATFSRFAGSRWRRPSGSTIVNSVPDLWHNTAHTLAGHLDFVKAAKKCGVWKRVCEIVKAEETKEVSR
jgi:hypothetical protein